MKRIKLPLRCMIHSQGEVNLRDVYDLMDAAKVNGLEVINASLAYEKYMEEIIDKYIFIERGDPSIDFFRNHILSADWFSFSAKRKIILAIVDKENIFSGKDTNILERQLGKTMSY